MSVPANLTNTIPSYANWYNELRGGQAATRPDRGFIAPAVTPAVAGARVGSGSKKEYTAESRSHTRHAAHTSLL